MKVNGGANLDHESAHSHVIEITASHKESENDDHVITNAVITVTINIGDVNEPLGAPGTPTSKGATTSSITATWTAPDTTGKPPILKYWVKYQEKGQGNYENTWTVYNSNEVLLDEIPDSVSPNSPLKPGTAYLVWVMAQNDEGYGKWSEKATLYTAALASSPATVPTTPIADPDTLTQTVGPGARESHPIALLTPANEPPSIINPGDKLYRQGDVIAAFGIDASDDGGPPLVEVAGLPDGLAFDDAAGAVFGRVAIDAPLGAHRVTVSATDGVLLASATFTITVADRPAQPASPGTGHGPASAGGAPALAEPHGGAAALLLLALAAALPLAARRRTRA